MAGNYEGNRDFEETNSKLAQGLKTCRTVVNTYRALLSSATDEGWSDENAGENGNEDGTAPPGNAAAGPEAPDLAASKA